MQSETASKSTGLLLGLAGVAIFGATLPMTRLALIGYSPLFITFGRALIAAVAAGAFLFWQGKRWPRGHGATLLLAGLCLVLGFPILSSVAMQTLPANHGGVILGVLPLMTSIFAALIDGERPSPFFWLLGLAGALIVACFSIWQSGFHPASGDLWLLGAALSASLGYVVSARLSRVLSGWEVISWALILMSPLTLAGTVASGLAGGIASTAFTETAGLLYLGLFSMFGGFVFWNEGLARGGIARVSQVQLLQSFFTLGFSALLLGERITIVTVVFAGLVALTVALARKARIS